MEFVICLQKVLFLFCGGGGGGMILYVAGESLLFSDGVDPDQSDVAALLSLKNSLAELNDLLFKLLLLLLNVSRSLDWFGSIDFGRGVCRPSIGSKLRLPLVNWSGGEPYITPFAGILLDLSGVPPGPAPPRSSKPSSSEKSVDPSSGCIRQSMFTFSNIVFFRCRACDNWKILKCMINPQIYD